MIQPTFIIAEIGTAHGGSWDKAVELMDAAIDSGADAIKFQWVYADEILHPLTGFVNLPGGKIPLYDRFKELEVEPSFFKKCLDYVHSRNKAFVCSPFGLRSLKELLAIEPDYVKIASPELNHFPLLKALAEYRKNQKKNGKKEVPVILSSGVSKLEDIKKAIEITGTEGVTLLHCITSYPAPEEEYNLKLIKTLSQSFNINCGVSDHSLGPVLVPCLAVSQGAVMIEKHITLSKETDGLDDPVALTPEQFGFMCHTVHQCDAVMRHYGKEKGEIEIIRQLSETDGKDKIQSIIGDGIKKLAPAETMNYGRTNRSLHYMQDLEKDHVIKEGDFSVLRTEKILTPGISPEYYEKIIGKKLIRNVCAGAGIRMEDFE